MADDIISMLDSAIDRKQSKDEPTKVRLNAAVQGIQDLINALQREHETEIKNMQKQIELLKSRDSSSDLDLLETAKKEITSMASRMENVAKRNKELEQEQRTHGEELKKANDANANLLKDLEREQEEIKQQKEKIEQQKVESALQKEEIEKLNKRIEEISVNNESSEKSAVEPENQNENESLLARIEELKKEKNRLAFEVKQAESLKFDFTNLQDRCKTIKKNETKAQKDAAKAKRNLKKAKSKIEDLKKEMDPLNTKIKELENQVEELQNEVQEAELRYTTVKNEMQSYRSMPPDFASMNELTSVDSTNSLQTSAFFDEQIDETELISAFQKRFPAGKKRSLSSVVDLLEKRDPADALKELYSESTSIITSLEAENKRLEAEKEAFLSELNLLRSTQITLDNMVGGGTTSPVTETPGEKTVSPNSGAIDFDVPDIPLDGVSVRLGTPVGGGVETSTEEPARESWKPQLRKKKRSAAKKSVEFSGTEVSWKPKMRRPKLIKDDSDIGLTNLTTITRNNVTKDRGAGPGSQEIKSATMANLMRTQRESVVSNSVNHSRRHTVGDIFVDSNNDDKKEEEIFKKARNRMQSMGSSGTHLNVFQKEEDEVSEMSELSVPETAVTEDEEVGGPIDVPKPAHFFSFDNEKTGLAGMVHMGVPFPRVKDFSLFFGDHWKSYLMTQQKFRYCQKGFTVSIFFKCSRSHLLDLHEPLTVISKGPVKKSTAIWVQRSRKDDKVYVYCCINCVYDNRILKLPLQTDFREASTWHHVAVRVKGRRAMLLLDDQQPVKGNLIAKNNRNRFQSTGQALYVGCGLTAERKGSPNNFFHGKLYQLSVWEEPLSLLQIKKIQQHGMYNINTFEHKLKHG